LQTRTHDPPPSSYKSLVKSGFAPVNGFEMYYEVHGTGAGTPLVTIHPAWGLANVFPSLARHRTQIAVDLRGHGRSSGLELPQSLENDAEDIAALLKHLQIDRADLFGESFGGTVALILAIRHPELNRFT
jgi:pimeloyl-ACP methyl ester carboxylesterase